MDHFTRIVKHGKFLTIYTLHEISINIRNNQKNISRKKLTWKKVNSNNWKNQKIINGDHTPNPTITFEKIHYLIHPEDKKIIMDLKKQKTPLSCKLQFHNMTEKHNGIRYCKKCGHIDFCIGIEQRLSVLKETHN